MSDMEYAQGWQPEPGALVIGRVTSVDAGWSDFRGQYPIITIADERTHEPVAVHGFHSGLFNQLVTQQPRVGERIAIKFVEKRPHKTRPGQTVSVYRVKIEGRTGDDVWARLAPQAPAQTPQQPQQPQQPLPATEDDFQVDDHGADDDIPF